MSDLERTLTRAIECQLDFRLTPWWRTGNKAPELYAKWKDDLVRFELMGLFSENAYNGMESLSIAMLDEAWVLANGLEPAETERITFDMVRDGKRTERYRPPTIQDLREAIAGGAA